MVERERERKKKRKKEKERKKERKHSDEGVMKYTKKKKVIKMSIEEMYNLVNNFNKASGV